MPIIVLITFLLGCIVAQQGIFHFRGFGAEVYVIDMIGILIPRELGVIMVSIIIAAGSGSAYTAELGSMKMREEVDALRTICSCRRPRPAAPADTKGLTALLPARCQWPHRCAAEQRDEPAAVHSITSSARASNVGGISMPSNLAV